MSEDRSHPPETSAPAGPEAERRTAPAAKIVFWLLILYALGLALLVLEDVLNHTYF